MSERKINTEYWAKPIPLRQFDWSATFDSYEPGGPIGYGRTEQQAINDLLEIDDADNGQFESRGMSVATAELISKNRERIYKALRAADFERYRKAIQAAEAVTLTFDLPQGVAVEIEAAVVLQVADALGLIGISP